MAGPSTAPLLVVLALALAAALPVLASDTAPDAESAPNHLERLPSDLLRDITGFALPPRQDALRRMDSGASDFSDFSDLSSDGDDAPDIGEATEAPGSELTRGLAKSISKRFDRVVSGEDWVPVDSSELARMEAARTGRYHASDVGVMASVDKFRREYGGRGHSYKGRLHGPLERDAIRDFRSGVERHLRADRMKKIVVLPGTYKDVKRERPLVVYTDTRMDVVVGEGAYTDLASPDTPPGFDMPRPMSFRARAALAFLESVRSALEGASGGSRFAWLVEPGAVAFVSELTDYSGTMPIMEVVLGASDSSMDAGERGPRAEARPRTMVVVLPGRYGEDERAEELSVITDADIPDFTGVTGLADLAASGSKSTAMTFVARLADQFLAAVETALGKEMRGDFSWVRAPGNVKSVTQQTAYSDDGVPIRQVVLGGEGAPGADPRTDDTPLAPAAPTDREK